MDIEKEREAFENFFYENCLVQWEKDISETLFQKFESGDYEYVRLQSSWLSWQAAKAQAVPEGFVLVPKEPSAELVNHGHQVFLGHFNECGQTGGRSLYFAYKAMLEAVEKNQ